MREDDIALIENWIGNGCQPDPPPAPRPLALSFTTGAHFTPEQHNDYWRDFGDWSMFNAVADVQDAAGIAAACAFIQRYSKRCALRRVRGMAEN